MNGVFPVVSALVLLAGMFVVMVRLDAFLALLALAVCPLLFAVIAAVDRPIVAAAAAARERESLMYSIVQRTMAAIRVVQAFTTEPQEQRRFLMELALRDTRAFLERIDAVPSTQRERWIGELSRYAAEAGSASTVAQRLRASGDPRARQIATSFESQSFGER